jgi:hypothetical protein
MENFPSSFMAKKVISKVNYYRLKKIEDDMKCIRKKIVKSFKGNVNYHSEVTHEMLPDLNEEEHKNFYCMIKDELQQRGFVVRGKIQGNTLSMIVFSNTPRNIEMDRVLKIYSDELSDTSSAHSSDKNITPTSNVNESTKQVQSSSMPNSPIAQVTKTKKTRSVSRSNSRSSSKTLSKTTVSKSDRKLSKIPRAKPRSSSYSNASKTMIKPDFRPESAPESQSHVEPGAPQDNSSEKAQKPSQEPSAQKPSQEPAQDPSQESAQDPSQEPPYPPQKLNMDFIMEKLKKANRKQNTLKKSS